MKRILLILSLCAVSPVLHAQSTNATTLPSPPPMARPVLRVTTTLTAAQTTALMAQIGTVVVAPAGYQIVGVGRILVRPNGTSSVICLVKPTAPITTQ